MSWLDHLLVRALPLVPRPVMERFAKRYVAGTDREHALEVGASLAGAGYRLTFDLLGEAVRDPAMVAAAAAEYRALLAALEARGLERNVSLKPTQMGLDLDPELCFRTVDALVEDAATRDGFVRFEMEESRTVPATLEVFTRLRERHGGRVGCVLQAMLRRSEDDARALLAAAEPLNVRLVKGIYVEPPEVAFQEADEIVASYLRILRVLLEGGAFVAVATHDERLVEGCASLLEEEPAWREQVELQMLLGVREDYRRRLREAGWPLRVYVPYGERWRAYVTRRLRENPRLARRALFGVFSRRERLTD